MRDLLLITTAFTVSVDSFFCGLSLSSQYKNNFKILLGICLSVFLTCFTGAISGKFLGDFLQKYAEPLGGVILYVVAVLNALSAKTDKPKLSKPNNFDFKISLIVGFGVGLDGALACFSLVAIGYAVLSVVTITTAAHVIAITIAVCVADSSAVKKLTVIDFIPPLILAILGAVKFAFFF